MVDIGYEICLGNGLVIGTVYAWRKPNPHQRSGTVSQTPDYSFLFELEGYDVEIRKRENNKFSSAQTRSAPAGQGGQDRRASFHRSGCCYLPYFVFFAITFHHAALLHFSASSGELHHWPLLRLLQPWPATCMVRCFASCALITFFF